MSVIETGFRKRGRPAKTPAGTTASDRTAFWRRKLQGDGGHSLLVNLGPLSWAALCDLAPQREKGPLIERLILDAAERAKSAGTPLAGVRGAGQEDANGGATDENGEP